MMERKIALSIEEAAGLQGLAEDFEKTAEWQKLPVLKVGRKVLIKTDIWKSSWKPTRDEI